MNWDGAPNYRWRKMYKGVTYTVTCAELRAMVLTEEATRKVANDWWERKLAELTGTPASVKLLEQLPDVEVLRRKIEQGKAAQSILREIEHGPRDAETVNRLICKAELNSCTGSPVEEKVERLLGAMQATEPQRAERMAQIVNSVAEVAVNADRTFRENAERFLERAKLGKKGRKIKPTSFTEIREFVRSLYTLRVKGDLLIGENADVASIDANKVEAVYTWLANDEISQGRRKKHWGFFQRLVRYLWSKSLIELPRNLEEFSFEVTPQAIKTYTDEEVLSVYQGLKPRFRLYALLGMNCGMTAADMGQLTKSMVDLDNGTLTRKRVKTQAQKNVPIVTYRLWPETVELLRAEQSPHPVLFLTSSDNTSLYESRFEGDDETPKKDLISLAWKRAKVRIPQSAFRSISSTKIESHREYGRYKLHFLGHSPKTIAEKHYAAPSTELFGEIILWLREQLLGV